MISSSGIRFSRQIQSWHFCIETIFISIRNGTKVSTLQPLCIMGKLFAYYSHFGFQYLKFYKGLKVNLLPNNLPAKCLIKFPVTWLRD